jgi:hypothetical protein
MCARLPSLLPKVPYEDAGETVMSKSPGMTAVVAAIDKPPPSASLSGYVRAGIFEGSDSNKPVGLVRSGDWVRGLDAESDPKSAEVPIWIGLLANR